MNMILRLSSGQMARLHIPVTVRLTNACLVDIPDALLRGGAPRNYFGRLIGRRSGSRREWISKVAARTTQRGAVRAMSPITSRVKCLNTNRHLIYRTNSFSLVGRRCLLQKGGGVAPRICATFSHRRFFVLRLSARIFA